MWLCHGGGIFDRPAGALLLVFGASWVLCFFVSFGFPCVGLWVLLAVRVGCALVVDSPLSFGYATGGGFSIVRLGRLLLVFGASWVPSSCVGLSFSVLLVFHGGRRNGGGGGTTTLFVY